MNRIGEPTSGLEPLTYSLRASCSVTEGVSRAHYSFTAVTVRRGNASVDGVQNSVEFTEKNVRTDLDAMQEMVEINSQSTPTTVIDGEVIIGFDKGRISEKLGL
jgi:glutaredoxin